MNDKRSSAALLRLATFVFLLVLLSAMGLVKATSLDSFKWQYRLLIIDVSMHTDRSALESLLNAHVKDIEDRKLRVILYTQDAIVEAFTNTPLLLEREVVENMLANKYSILVGLDGGIKSFYEPSANTIDINQVFADIDGMPMRKLERQN
ncbi:DUF4174 domain-containing protein [Glaciecola sp. XM2]|uniref:DUF4174 domain-containing protein n=1 Tax=Glaciecola sp. XM2 TaxID=1914931 RepID=UPI001BDF106D|nr:DUF4174 domain-containing protein [Glaciecola sp. XM2]